MTAGHSKDIKNARAQKKLQAIAERQIRSAAQKNMMVLKLSGLGLSKLPDIIGQLTRLRTLYINSNQLTALPDIIGQLTQLQTLFVSANQLTALSDSIGQLTQLQTLYISGNQLTALPDSIGQLTQLQTLFVSANQLTALPDSIGQLTHLQTLDISDNQLTALPDSIGQLTHLQTLDLSNNHLITLPTALRRLSLKDIYLHGNETLGLPEEVLGPISLQVMMGKGKHGMAASILDYYFRVRAAARPLNEAKLIIVGRGGVGKTCLVKRLLHDAFDPNEKQTEGIRIDQWTLRLRNSEEVRLNLWDFGGQEIMHATHQFFLTQRSLYLLVLEGRQGAEDADTEYWLKLIESFGTEEADETSPVLIVLNKIKKMPFDLNRRALQQKYPFIKGFIATDCADGTGMAELKDAISIETDRLKHLRDSFPQSWFAIKDELAGMKRSYITFDQYRVICRKHGENDAAAQDSLANHLHNLGIALNYKDDFRLRDTHVLNPEWATGGIYRLLNSPVLKSQKGEISLSDAAKVLPVRQYPVSMHLFLFQLMKKFELCFAFSDDEHHLIPELLDIQEPLQTAEFRPQESLRFEYRYPVLPHGLLPRFIVRTRVLSTGLPRWRTGVILAFEGNRALVTADPQDKRVSIYVNGPVSGRRRLLAIVRSDFEHIHASISKLNPRAFVPIPHLNQSVPYSDLLIFEANEEHAYSIPVADKVIKLDVQELLNGVDMERTRKKERFVRSSSSPAYEVSLFYSYCHKDEALRNELETHLKLLERQGVILPWHDRLIGPGDEWKQQIDEHLQSADIVLLLVSADFIGSDYCYEKEMKQALEHHENRKARVIPVILRDVNWKRAPFAKLQALPTDGKAVTLWPNKDSAWRNVSEGIERVAEEIRQVHSKP